MPTDTPTAPAVVETLKRAWRQAGLPYTRLLRRLARTDPAHAALYLDLARQTSGAYVAALAKLAEPAADRAD